MDCSLPGSSVHGDSPGKNTRLGCHALLQGIFQTQGLNPGLPHCRWILYHLSHRGSPWIPEWVAHLFSSGSSWPRNWTGVSCIVGRFFNSFHLLNTYLPGICKSLCSLTYVILAYPIREMLLIFPIFTDEENKDRGVRAKFPSYLYILFLSCCVGYIHIKPPLVFYGMLANKKLKEQNKYF